MSAQTYAYLRSQGITAELQIDSVRADVGDQILNFSGESLSIPGVTPWMAENIRDVVGDDVLVNASGNQLVAGTVIVSTGAVVGGYYAAGAGTALAGGNGWAAASSGLGAINTISLANNAASLTIDPTLREGFDTTADLVNMGMTVGGKLLNGRTKYAATILDIGINGAQSAIGVNDAVTNYEAGHEKWAYFQAAMAGLGFAGAGLRFHQEFEVNTSGRSFSTSMLGTGVFDRITVRENKAAGDTVRDMIATREAPAVIEQTFLTVGGARRIGVLKIGDELIGIESKVGRTSLDSGIRQELARDWWLRRQGQLNSVLWEFSKSDITGKIGPTKPLL